MNIPNGSRLYVGNLPLSYDSKEEIAKVFAKYGDILSISFETGKRTLVQFKTKEACANIFNLHE
jgi:RNA recognition motif-containing protein